MNKVIKVIHPIKGKLEGDVYTPKPKKKVAAYARVSTNYQDQINSYIVQCDEYTKMIQSNPDYTFVGVYADQGLSGTQAKKRPEFMRMIEAARNGEIDLIITKSISRFARNTVDVINYKRELTELGVEIYFEKENISSLDPRIDFTLTLLSSIAQEESFSHSSNVKLSYKIKFRNGIVDPKRMFGYEVINNIMTIKSDEAKVVKLMFSLILKLYKITDVKKILNERSILSINGRPWTFSAIRFILKNEKYCGDAILQKTVTTDYLTKKFVINDNVTKKYYVFNSHDAIVTRETFEMVQLLLTDDFRHYRNNSKTTKYPLSGISFCPMCGRSLKRQQINRGQKMRVVLNCNHKYGSDYYCSSKSPNYDFVIETAKNSILNLLTEEQVLNKVLMFLNVKKEYNKCSKTLSLLKLKNAKLIESYHMNPDNIDLFNQFEHNNLVIKRLEQKLVELFHSIFKFKYLKKLLKSNLNNLKDSTIKNIYSAVIADKNKIVFVISKTKNLLMIPNLISLIVEKTSILYKTFIRGNDVIQYEIKLV